MLRIVKFFPLLEKLALSFGLLMSLFLLPSRSVRVVASLLLTVSYIL